MKKFAKPLILTVLFVALIPIVFFLIRACFNLVTITDMEEQFANTDYIKLLSSGLSYLLFMVIWLLIDFYWLTVFLKKGEIKENILFLYRFKIQLIFLAVLIILNFIVKFVLFNNLQCVIYISTVIIVLLLIMIIIDLINLLKDHNAKVKVKMES